MNVNSRLIFFAATAALLMGAMMPQTATATSEEQLKELQNQVAVLQQQIQLVNLQQTQTASQQMAVVTALKNQVSAQSDLEKAMAQGAFAKLAGIKAGLDSVGAPVSKDGTITVSAGTAGALLLSLRKPMLEGLEKSATAIAAAVKAKSPVYVGTDAQVQSALQASVLARSLEQSITALDASTKAVQDKIGRKVTAAFFTEAAAAGLVLNTVVGLDKFFRVDTTYTVFDAGDEAQQTLMLMVQQKLGTAAYRNLAAVSISVIMKQAEAAQAVLLAVKQRYDAGAAVVIEVSKMKADDPLRPTQDVIDRLNSDLAVAKALLDALHPALKPDGFWGYVQGLTALQQMGGAGNKFFNRLVLQAKAQTIQVVEKRTWRSDKIFGRSDIQIDYRVIDSDGNLLDSGLTLATFDAADATVVEPIYSFQPKQTTEAAQQPKQTTEAAQQPEQ